MNSVLIKTGLLALCTVFYDVYGQACLKNEDCETCGICVDSVGRTPPQTECVYPYPKTIKDDRCSFKHNMCDGYLCNNGGTCRVAFGFAGPVCECDYNKFFMGPHCDIKWDRANQDSWVSGVAVLFNQFKGKSNSLHLYSVYVFAVVYSAAKNLQFYLETSEGFVIRFNQPWKCSSYKHTRIYPHYPLCESCSTALPESCQILYRAVVQFPYNLAPGPGRMTVSGEVIGYMANVTIVAKTLNMGSYQEVYRAVHPIMVNYENLRLHEREFMPVIELLNCGRTLEERVLHHSKSTISLNSKILIPPSNYTYALQPVWGIWDVEKFRDDYNVEALDFKIGTNSWFIKPFSLEKSIYRVRLKVTILLEDKSIANFAECYIEVVDTAIMAIISGGSKITVNKNKKVIISGAKSYNPNQKFKNRYLQFSWSCSPECDDLIHEFAYGQIYIPSNLLELGKTYIISLRVSERGHVDGFAFQEMFVSDEEMSVSCLMNCLEKVIPSDPLLLEVILPGNQQTKRTFKWTTTDESGIVDEDKVKCKNHEYPSYLLCIEPHTLRYGGAYYFKADMVGSDAVTGIQLYIGQVSNITCVITPLKGIRFKTSFNISCAKSEKTDTSWVFEFFDKFNTSSSSEISGRMIANNNLGKLTGFKVTRGVVCVYLFDTNGMVSHWKQEIELTRYIATIEDIDTLFVEMANFIESNELEQALKKASLISDLIEPGFNKTYIAEKWVYLISKVPYESQGISKLGLVTIKNFIISVTKEGDYKVNPATLKSLTREISALTHWTDYVMSLSNTAVPSITDGMLKLMATATAEVVESVHLNRNASFLVTNLEDLKLADYDDALEASVHTEAVMNRIGLVLSARQGTGYAKTSVASTTNLSIVTVQSDYLHVLANAVNRDAESPLKLSEKLIKELSSVEELAIHFTTIKYNPFWTSRKGISTKLLSLNLYSKHSSDYKLSRIDYTNNGIDLFLEELEFKNGSVEVTKTQLDLNSELIEDGDKQVTVLRLDLVGRSKLFLSFTFQNETDNIKVYVTEEIRPDYDLVNSFGTVISSKNTMNETPTNDGNDDMFVYIGILPGPDVPVNRTVNVTVHFHYHLCLTWLKHNWVSQYCKVGTTLNNSNIHCSCTHLSFFSAVFAVPPNEVDPFNDIGLFLTLKDNWFIVAFMACLLMVFFLLGLWAVIKDKKDEVQRKVLILEDNFPGDNNSYLLAVFTGCRLNAGTNANVGVLIEGSESSSRSHILKSSRRKVLQRNSEDWFMIQTPFPLGVITQIHVWHDNSGPRPAWYCNKMVVYDLETSITYTFFMEQWLALENDEFCEAVLLPATSEDMDNVKRIFFDNITFGFRDADMSGSILARHPRSRIDRLDRVVILLCFIVMALIISLAFYDNGDGEGVDDFGYSLATQDILISIQTFIISSVFLLLISYTFSKAYKPKKEQREHANLVVKRAPQKSPTPQTRTTATAASVATRNPDVNSFYHRMVRRIRTTFHPLPLSPVVLSKSSAKVKTNRIIYSAAWLMSVVLITCCVYFILLYGLKLGQEESKKWLSSITLVLAQEFLVMSPLKIVLAALLLVTTFERFTQISYYSVNVEDVSEDEQKKTKSFFLRLIKKRSHSMYRPLNVLQSDLLRRKRRAWTSWRNLVDLIVLLIYISIICQVTSDNSIHTQLHANRHVAQMALDKHAPKNVNFQDVTNRSLYHSYLERTFVAALYAMRWYNDENLNPPEFKIEGTSKWWTMDTITKFVGPPTCRQIRVDREKCSLNRFTKNSSVRCIPNWDPDVEDNDDYDVGWRIAVGTAYKEKSAWKYVFPAQSNRPSRQGATWTTYHGGGYMVSLSSDRFDTVDTMHTLKDSEWIDEFTRVVFLDFTLFNVNENLFTDVVLVAEHLPFGLYVTRSMIHSVQLDMIHSVWKVGFILLIVIILFHVCRMLSLMNRKGFLNFFSKFVNIYQLFVTALGVLSIIFFVIHVKTSLHYTETFQRRGLDVFFEFDRIAHYSIISANILTVLFCCLSFRLFSLWPFGGNFPNIYQSLLFSGKTIIAQFPLLFCVYIFVFCRLVSYLLNFMLSFSAFYWSWSKSVHMKSSSIPDTTVMFLLSFSIKLCHGYILMLFCYLYKLGKTGKINQSDFVVLFKWITRKR